MKLQGRPMQGIRQTGFTLMELMVAVSVVAILTVIVMPLYRSSVHKSKRAECRSALVLAMQNEERYFTNNNAYNTLAAIGVPAWSGTSTTGAGAACTLDTYAGTVGSGGSQLTAAGGTVVVVATPSGWSDTECNAGAYGLDSAGNFSPLTGSLAAVATSSIPANCF